MPSLSEGITIYCKAKYVSGKGKREEVVGLDCVDLGVFLIQFHLDERLALSNWNRFALGLWRFDRCRIL